VPRPESRSVDRLPAGNLSLRQGLAPHAGLLSLLTIATFFEGFDTKLAGLVQPLLGREFGASNTELGLVLGLSSLGMVLAFFVIHLADWVGRRPVFLGALGAYALLTLATVLSPNLLVYTALQFFARMAMVVELSLAYLILSEELVGEVRGRANGMLGAFASLGAAVPLALLAPLEAFGFGWRGLFVVGALPLLLFPLYLTRIQETRAYRERRARGDRRPFDWRDEWALLRRLFVRSRATRLAGVTLLWFTVNFWAGATMGFLTIYAFNERGWNSGDLSWLPAGTIPVGFAGYVLGGIAMDRLGRRAAATLYLLGAFVVTLVCFQSESKLVIYAAWATLVGLNGVWTITTTWTLELFPTDLRATALGVCANLLGRTGMVIGPILAGALSTAWASTSTAISVLAGVILLCLPVVWWVLPETRGLDLSYVSDVPRVSDASEVPEPVPPEPDRVPNV
jgi:putative MFS transporter